MRNSTMNSRDSNRVVKDIHTCHLRNRLWASLCLERVLPISDLYPTVAAIIVPHFSPSGDRATFTAQRIFCAAGPRTPELLIK
jgi:hypothetical protein